MSRASSALVLLLLVVVIVVAVATVGSGREQDATAAGRASWWAGRAVGDLALDREAKGLVAYGTCEPSSGDEGGCSPPLQLQIATTCGRNPVGLDVVPLSIVRRPGGAIVTGDGDGLDVGTDRSTVTVFADSPSTSTSTLAQLRPRDAVDPVATLPPPRYPRAVLAELRRVVDQRRRTPGTRRVARAVGLPLGVVRTRLRLADLLPRDALKGIDAPRLSTKEIERRRQAVFSGGAGVPERTYARWKRSVRGLTGGC